MIGVIAIIFLAIPETPWWLASKGKVDKAAKVLELFYGKVEGHDIQEQIVSNLKLIVESFLTRQEIMTTTVAIERQQAERNSEEGMWAVFRGRNLLRFIISGWPKITQQFVGLAVFNTYATYFCKFTIR